MVPLPRKSAFGLACEWKHKPPNGGDLLGGSCQTAGYAKAPEPLGPGAFVRGEHGFGTTLVLPRHTPQVAEPM